MVKKDKNLVHVVIECHLVEGGNEAGNEEGDNGNGNGQPGDDFDVEQWILAEGQATGHDPVSLNKFYIRSKEFGKNSQKDVNNPIFLPSSVTIWRHDFSNKSELSKNVNNKNCFPKLILFNAMTSG